MSTRLCPAHDTRVVATVLVGKRLVCAPCAARERVLRLGVPAVPMVRRALEARP